MRQQYALLSLPALALASPIAWYPSFFNWKSTPSDYPEYTPEPVVPSDLPKWSSFPAAGIGGPEAWHHPTDAPAEGHARPTGEAPPSWALHPTGYEGEGPAWGHEMPSFTGRPEIVHPTTEPGMPMPTETEEMPSEVSAWLAAHPHPTGMPSEWWDHTAEPTDAATITSSPTTTVTSVPGFEPATTTSESPFDPSTATPVGYSIVGPVEFPNATASYTYSPPSSGWLTSYTPHPHPNPYPTAPFFSSISSIPASATSEHPEWFTRPGEPGETRQPIAWYIGHPKKA